MVSNSLGNYQIIEPLDENDNLSVFKGWDDYHHRDVVIKVVCFDCAGNANFLNLFDQQAGLLRQLSHPHIIRVLDHNIQEGVPYLAIDYIPGGSLKQHLVGNPLPWLETIKMLIPIAQALAYAHQKDVIHGSVNPLNIISQDGEIPVNEKLFLDFGVKSLLGMQFNPATSATSPGPASDNQIYATRYLAPEQVRGEKTDFHADIYALGLIWYELIAGYCPFEGDTLAVVLQNKLNQPVPSLNEKIPGLPGAVNGVLIKAIAKNPEERFTSMDAFAQALISLTEVKITSNINQNVPASSSEEVDDKPARAEPESHKAPTESSTIKASLTKAKQIGWTRRRFWMIGAVVAALILFSGALLYLSSTNQLGNMSELKIKVNIPPMLQVGDKFDLVVKIKNTGNHDITINEIGVPNILLNAVTMKGAMPIILDEHDYIDYNNYSFDLVIKPDQTVIIAFDMVAQKDGIYRGQVSVRQHLNSIYTKFQTQITK
jgi:eukaryotic-like serine/threonine-protein kinase